MQPDQRSELRDVLKTLHEPAAPAEKPARTGDSALMFTWGGCLVAIVIDIAVGYSSFAEQDSSPKQVAAMALTFLGIGGAYVVARCVHEMILASRRMTTSHD